MGQFDNSVSVHHYSGIIRDCSIATGADSKIARQEQGESTWDPLNASELAPNSANGLIPSLITWAKSQPPGNVAIVSIIRDNSVSVHHYSRKDALTPEFSDTGIPPEKML